MSTSRLNCAAIDPARPTAMCCCPSRRAVLGGAAAMALSLPMALAGAAPARAQSGPARIDTHHHVFPPFYLQRERARIYQTVDTNPAALFDWTPARALEQMDAHGVATAIVSLVPGVWFGDVAEGRAIARDYHEYAARLCADHPSRFGFFAALPLPDVSGSLAEIAYAFDTLKADGVVLMTNYGDKWPGDPAFDAVFAELDRRRAVVFFHPATAACCGNLIPGMSDSTVEFLFDSTRTILSLMVNGTMARYPNIRFIFAHTGGATSALAHRIDTFFARHKELHDRLPDGAIGQLRKLHYDIANSVNPATMTAIRSLVPVSQLVFGSDYPVLPLALTADSFDRFELPDAERAAINRGNAERLFPRFAG
jgi:predicted TIM-barrel fold metal-dependent hydrolase